MKLWIEQDGKMETVHLNTDDNRVSLVIDGRSVEGDVQWIGQGFVSLLIDGRSYDFLTEAGPNSVIVLGDGARLDTRVSRRPPRLQAAAGASSDASESIRSPMPGKVVELLVEEGQTVTKGQGILIVEAMKMENELRAQADGSVKRLHVEAGQVVDGGALLAEIGPC